MSKILIISQGGRATSSFQSGQYMPDKEGFQTFLDWIKSDNNKDFDFMSISEDVLGGDSCHPEHCNQLGKIIEDHYDDYDGFFIIRGPVYSDYVGASLTFALRGNHKPILIGDSEGSFTNPISNTESFILRGLHYLSTLGQTPERRKDVAILSDNLIVRAVDATLFADGSMRYYSRTGNNLQVEELYAVPDNDNTPAPRNDLKRIPLRESLNIPLVDGVHSYNGEFALIADTNPDAIIVKTTWKGGVVGRSTRENPYMIMYNLSERDVPTIFTNKLPHGGVITPFSDWVVCAETMATTVALAKARYALTVADGDIEKFRAIMLENMHGEIPNEADLIMAKRPESKRGARMRL